MRLLNIFYLAGVRFVMAGYTGCCDWWSVGVILYEMRIGRPPFYASTRDETQMKVRHIGKTTIFHQSSRLL